MKIEISKPNQHAPITVKVTPDSKSKPLVLELRRDQLIGLMDVAKAAVNADTFSFLWEQ